MFNWELNLGTVQLIDDEDVSIKNVELIIRDGLPEEYENVVPKQCSSFSVELRYNDQKSLSSSSELLIRIIDKKTGKVELNNNIYILSHNQIDSICRIEGAMVEFDNDEDEEYSHVWYDSNNNIYHLSLGLAKYYNKSLHDFLVTDVIVLYDEKINKTSIKLKQYNNLSNLVYTEEELVTMNYQDQPPAYCFLRFEGDDYMYKICDSIFILNSFQASILEKCGFLEERD